MQYQLRFTLRATRDLESLYESINAPNSEPSIRWYRKLEETIRLLSTVPRMGAAIHEGAARRQVVYGNKPHLYRVIYKVDDTAKTVTVLQIRHGKRLMSHFQ